MCHPRDPLSLLCQVLSGDTGLGHREFLWGFPEVLTRMPRWLPGRNGRTLPDMFTLAKLSGRQSIIVGAIAISALFVASTPRLHASPERVDDGIVND